MPNPNRICFTPEPGHSNEFGSSVAINSKYLAIGDPGANRVTLYSHKNLSQWVKIRDILLPNNSSPDVVVREFGKNLQLDGDSLAISASMNSSTEKGIEFLYLVKIDFETEVEFIGRVWEKNAGLVKFNLLSEGKIIQIALPDNGEKSFGSSFAIHKNLLLVGSPSFKEEQGAWLFDIKKTKSKPIRLAIPKVDIGDTVAISEKFAVVGNFGRWWYYSPDNSKSPTKTLIRAIDSGLTTYLDNVGKVSLSGDILAIMHIPPPSQENYGFLEVFRLDDNAVPRRIYMRTDVSDAWVQNGFLITLLWDSTLQLLEVCVQSIHQKYYFLIQ